MILSRLFGARAADDDEPAAHPPVATARPGGAPRKPRTGGAEAVKPAEAGFDPYNSGAFKKSSAWERVTRR